jgi:hypothetical protein
MDGTTLSEVLPVMNPFLQAGILGKVAPGSASVERDWRLQRNLQ